MRRVAAVAAGALALALAWTAFTWPDAGRLAVENPGTTAFIERHRRRELDAGRPGGVEWTWVPLSRISRNLALAVLVSEDDTFFQHHGFAVAQMKEAVADAWEEKKAPRGASTITQQVAKNLWLSPSRNPLRKAKEAILTMQLEHELEKRRILEIYLNVAEFGPGVYGAEAASRRYFGKPASDLTDLEAAQLAAGLPKPSKWHPGSSSRAWQNRTRIILGRMPRSRSIVDRL